MQLTLNPAAENALAAAAALQPARAPEPDFAWRVLEEIDYGLIVVGGDGQLQHANHLGRHELARARFLRVAGNQVAGGSAPQTVEVLRAVGAAAQGRRQMLMLRSGNDTLPVACVPLQAGEGEHGTVLLMLGRQADTRNLNLTFFSRTHGLTPTEEAVLKALCEGLDVQDIASAHGVSVCTVRTQVRALRLKTGAGSIRLLVQRVAALPPLVPMSLAAAGSGWAQSHA